MTKIYITILQGSYTHGDGGNGSYGSPRYASDRYRGYDNSYDARYSYDDRYGYDNYYSNEDRYRSHRHDRYDSKLTKSYILIRISAFA